LEDRLLGWLNMEACLREEGVVPPQVYNTRD